MAQLRIDIILLTKQFMAVAANNVNAVGTWGKVSRHKDSDSEAEAKYLDR